MKIEFKPLRFYLAIAYKNGTSTNKCLLSSDEALAAKTAYLTNQLIASVRILPIVNFRPEAPR